MNKIANVVVTYNRINDLKKCIACLRSQSCQDFDIIVVNNGSNDGTKEYLDSESGLIVIHQDNVGGAGGFYSGMKYMFDHGYEWLWMMDDDGMPDMNQLKELLSFAESKEKKFLNAFVVNKDNHEELSFVIIPNTNVKTFEKEECIEGKIAPFNGTFIHRSIIEKVGFIKKEMFIWGDEQELTKRICKAGYIPYTVVKAIHYHPKEKGTFKYVLPGIIKGRVLTKPEKMSHYYYRNLGYIDWNYMSPFYICIKRISYYTIYFVRTGQIKELFKFYRYYLRGINNNYK